MTPDWRQGIPSAQEVDAHAEVHNGRSVLLQAGGALNFPWFNTSNEYSEWRNVQFAPCDEDGMYVPWPNGNQ